MAMIDIEYRHSAEPGLKEIRRTSIKQMSQYLTDLVCEMQMDDISSKFVETETDGRNMVYVNGKSVLDILDGLEIKLLNPDDACGSNPIVSFGRPPLEWNEECIEDIPDTLMKNAISKVFSEIYNNRIL